MVTSADSVAFDRFPSQGAYRLNFEHYRNFTVIVEAGTFSAAAQRLLIAQPTLSNQVKALESEYGAQLLNRGSRRLELTPAGRMLYECAKNICYLEDSVKKDIKSRISGHQGVLRLGLTHAAMDLYIEKLLFAFHDEYPGVQFEVTLNTSGKNVSLLTEDKLDVGFIRVSDHPPTNLDYLSTVEETLVAYYSSENPWIEPSVSSVDIAELKGIPLCLTIGLREKLTKLCQQVGFSPYYLCAAATRNQALVWTAHNLSVTVLFCNSANIPQEGSLHSCRVTSFGSPITALRSFVTCRDLAPSATAKLFLGFVQNYNGQNDREKASENLPKHTKKPD